MLRRRRVAALNGPATQLLRLTSSVTSLNMLTGSMGFPFSSDKGVGLRPARRELP
jgi:hypothetical protein